MPVSVRTALEQCVGFEVVRAATQTGGFSPGVAARVYGGRGERAFVKVASSLANPVTPGMHRDEARFAALLPPGHPSPRLLGSYDDGTWVGLAYDDVDGRQPGAPWTEPDLAAAIAALDRQALVPAHADLPTVWQTHGQELRGWQELTAQRPSLTAWEERHLERLVALERMWGPAAAGDRWLHLDTRGDNMLVLGDGTAVLVDWPGSCAGNPAFDAVAFVPAGVRDGAAGAVAPGVPVSDIDPQVLAQACEQVLLRCAAARAADPDAVTAMVCAFAGLMQHRMRQPAPPSMPTVRAFQATQGVVALAWLAYRTGWP